MVSYKVILKAAIYIFIAGWMFLLGIMVGRGTSPVTFDTEQFQKRLEAIANEFGENKKPDEKVELQFYEVLDNPALEENKSTKEPSKSTTEVTAKEIVPIKEPEKEKMGLKTSKKKETFKANPGKLSSVDSLIKKPTTIDLNSKKEKQSENQKITTIKKKNTSSGKYTIQIAAYKDLNDALSQMASLDEKGFSSYKTEGKKDGILWYRVRMGDFLTHEDAKKFKLKLDKIKIKSMIIKK